MQLRTSTRSSVFASGRRSFQNTHSDRLAALFRSTEYSCDSESNGSAQVLDGPIRVCSATCAFHQHVRLLGASSRASSIACSKPLIAVSTLKAFSRIQNLPSHGNPEADVAVNRSSPGRRWPTDGRYYRDVPLGDDEDFAASTFSIKRARHHTLNFFKQPAIPTQPTFFSPFIQNQPCVKTLSTPSWHRSQNASIICIWKVL